VTRSGRARGTSTGASGSSRPPATPALGRPRRSATVATSITGHRTLLTYKLYGIRQESVQRAALEKAEAYVRNLNGDTGDESSGRKAG